MCYRDDNFLTHKGFSLCSGCAEKYGMDKVDPSPERKHDLASKIQIKSEPEANKLYLDFSYMDKETLGECLLAYFGEKETSISKIISRTIGSCSTNGVPRVEELGEERYCLDFSNLRCATRIDWGFLESLVIPEHIFLSALKKFFHYIRDIEGGMWESSVE
jgi:hypothetical protein